MQIERPKSRQPMPDNAKKVFSGVIFDVYQWEVENFRGKKMILEKLKRKDDANVIAVTLEKKIIISHEEQPGKPPFLAIPGGAIEEGEDVIGSAARELAEETGYVAKEWSLLFSVQAGSKIDKASYYLVAHDCEKTVEQDLDGGEKVWTEEVGFEEFLKLIRRDDFRDSTLKLFIYEALLDEEKMEKLKNQLRLL